MRPALRSLLLLVLWRAVAARVRKDQPLVVAITGSVGKTSARDAIVAALAVTGRPIVQTVGEFNTEFGVPMSIIGIREKPNSLWAWLKVFAQALKPYRSQFKESPYYVLEYAADKPGDIGYLTRKLPPHVAVLTNIVPVHMQNYPDEQALIKEKMGLVRGLAEGGIAVINAHDPAQQGVAVRHCLYQVGSGGKAAVKVVPQSISLAGRRVSIQVDTKSAPLLVNAIGKHHLNAVAAAVAVASLEGVLLETIVKGLAGYQVPPGRGRIIEGVKGITLIDDSYNASPAAVKAGLDMVAELPGNGRRKVAILGTMNELGDYAAQAHKEVAEYALAKVDYVIFVGQFSQQMVKAAVAAGLPSHKAISFLKPERLLAKLDQVVTKGDVVFIKGSQNKVRLERVVKKLMAHPEQAAELLPRQSAYWNQQS